MFRGLSRDDSKERESSGHNKENTGKSYQQPPNKAATPPTRRTLCRIGTRSPTSRRGGKQDGGKAKQVVVTGQRHNKRSIEYFTYCSMQDSKCSFAKMWSRGKRELLVQSGSIVKEAEAQALPQGLIYHVLDEPDVLH